MARFNGPVFKNLTDLAQQRPDLVAFGRKMLGYLDIQRRLSGVKSQSMTRQLPDGSIVTASWIGDIPQLRITTLPQRGGSKISAKALFGFVTKPRKFGTTFTLNNGQNAFGQHAHTLLLSSADPDNEAELLWQTTFYDASYVPEDYDPLVFATNGEEVLFSSGLAAHGNVDWRDAAEKVAITWVGAPSRIWVAGMGLPSTNLNKTNNTRIYHNGRMLVNHTLKYQQASGFQSDEFIAGACLKKVGTQAHLIYVTRSGYTSSSDYAVRAYAVALEPDIDTFPWLEKAKISPVYAPLFKAVDLTVEPERAVLVAEKIYPDLPDTQSGYGLATMFFNQSATQARGILIKNDVSVEEQEFVELVLDVTSDLSDMAFEEILHGAVIHTRTVENVYTTVQPNFYANISQWATDDPTPTTEGVHILDYYPKYTAPIVVSPFDVLLGQGVQTITLAPDNTGPFPLAVDFQDDVPVYLWWAPETETEVITKDCSWTMSETGSRTDEVTVNSSGTITSTVSTVEKTLTVAGSSLGNKVKTTSGGRFYFTDADGITWLDLSTDLVTSNYHNQTATMDKSVSGVISGAITKSSSYTIDSDIDGTVDTLDYVFLWADLRSKSVTYLKKTNEEGTIQDVSVVGVTGTFNTTDDLYANMNRTTTSTSHTVRRYGVEVRVYFYGEEVRQMSGLYITSTSPSTSVSTGAVALNQGAIGSTLFNKSGYTVGVNSAEAALLEASFLPPGSSPYSPPGPDPNQVGSLTTVVTQTPDDVGEDVYFMYSMTYPAALVQSGDRFPDVDEEPTSSLDEFYPFYDTRWGAWIAYRGAWAYSMHDFDRDDPRTLLYTSDIKSGDIQVITGNRTGTECFEQMWPLSYCVISYTEKST